MDEKSFYKFFGSLEGVKGTIWETFYDNAMSLLEKDENFEGAKPKEKLLSFYFTFFEVLLLNRSYVLFALSGSNNMMMKMGQLSSLRKMFKAFSAELIEDGNIDKPSYLQHPPKIFSEAAWVQIKPLRSRFKRLLTFLTTPLCQLWWTLVNFCGKKNLRSLEIIGLYSNQ
jgi:AcrR family transcriptional regulator